MKHYFLLSFASLILLLSSCQKEETLVTKSFESSTLLLESRTSQNLAFKIKVDNSSIIEINGSSFSATYASANGFNVIVNPNTENQQTFTAIEMEVSQPSNELNLVKDPGTQSQCIYENKYKGVLSINEQNSLSLSINDGAIISSGTNIVVEETGGL